MACLQRGHTAAVSIAVRTSHLCQRGLLCPETAPRALRVRVPRASPIPSPGVSVTSREDPRGHRQVSWPHLCTSHSLQEAILREKTAQGPGAQGTPRTAALTPQQRLSEDPASRPGAPPPPGPAPPTARGPGRGAQPAAAVQRPAWRRGQAPGWVPAVSRGAGKAERGSSAGLSNPSISTHLGDDWPLAAHSPQRPLTCGEQEFGHTGERGPQAPAQRCPPAEHPHPFPGSGPHLPPAQTPRASRTPRPCTRPPGP